LQLKIETNSNLFLQDIIPKYITTPENILEHIEPGVRHEQRLDSQMLSMFQQLRHHQAILYVSDDRQTSQLLRNVLGLRLRHTEAHKICFVNAGVLSGANFTNILQAAFAPIFFAKKLQSQIVIREKLPKHSCMKKLRA